MSPKKGNKKQGASERNKYKIQFFLERDRKRAKYQFVFKKFLFLQHFLCPFLFIHFISFLLYMKKRIKKVKKNYKKGTEKKLSSACFVHNKKYIFLNANRK